jgi:ABC-type multidrug transport system fused ATPase/permease subunit
MLGGMSLVVRAVREEPAQFTTAVAGSALFTTLTIFSAYLSGAIVTRVMVPAASRGGVGLAWLLTAAGLVLATALGRAGGLYARRRGAGGLWSGIQARYRRRVVRRYLMLPPSWHQRHGTGVLLSNVNADVEAMAAPLIPLPLAVGTVVMLVGSTAALWVTDWPFGLIAVAIFPALMLINFVYSRHASERVRKAQQLLTEVSATAHESFGGALLVKASGRELEETARFSATAWELRNAMIRVGPRYPAASVSA